jgi:hypothetical protein
MMGQAIMNSPALIALVRKIFIKPGSSITKSIGRYNVDEKGHEKDYRDRHQDFLAGENYA